jgi:hypothetical protein
MASASVVLTSDTSGSVTVTVPSGTSIGTTTLTLPTTGGTIQTSGSGYTTNGVAYASSTSALATGSALTFNGTNLAVTGALSVTQPITSTYTGTYAISSTSAGSGPSAINLYNTSGNLIFGVEGTAGGSLVTGSLSNAIILASYVNKPIQFGIYDSIRATIDTSGNLLVGTTTAVAGANISSNVSYDGNGGISVKNTSTGTSAGAAVKFLNSGSANAYIGLYGTSRTTYVNLVANALVNYTDRTAGIAYLVDAAGPITYGTNSTLRMTIDASGNIGAPSGTNIYNASDARLKKNITSLPSALNKVNALKPVSFNWIDDFCKEENNKLMYGFIAQEVKEVDETLIENFSNSTLKVGDVDIENPLRVNEKFIIPMLTKAIQELSALVTAQSATITSLTERITALEGK